MEKLLQENLSYKVKKRLITNLFHCFNKYRNVDDAFKFYKTTFYGVLNEDKMVRQVSSNLVKECDFKKIVSFNELFKKIKNSGLEDLDLIVEKVLDEDLGIENRYKEIIINR